ncbi:MAG TPA: twin-arginine translocation signal domain-containing protein [Dehalococcoidia bacterium]|nr:twin-arginine translocation signal domain-containing protein [Dehalococcoidia bacterium]
MRQIDRNSSAKRQGRGVSRRRFLQGVGLLGALAGLGSALGCRGGQDGVATTLERVIIWGENGTLALGPGQAYQVRTDLAEAKAGRERRRRSLAVFHHLTDFRLTDEESPLRSEWVESCPTPLATTAFRPQESLSAQAAAAMIAAANRIDRSPVTGRPVDFAVHTGNAADNGQYNELRWFLSVMDGGTVQPDSGSAGYEGVQRESPLGAYPDLLEEAQRPFLAAGLEYPWYAVLGNHDVLAQGNFSPSQEANDIAVGTEKIIGIGAAAKDEVCQDPSKLLDPGSSERILRDPDTEVRQVTADANRRLLSRKEWVAEHFKTGERPGPAGHGFTPGNLEGRTAYYVVERGPVSFIVLDTVNPGGFAAGSMDAAQFAWLEEQLVARSSRYLDTAGRTVTTTNEDRLVVIVSHHTTEAMNNPFPGPSGEGERVRGPQVEELLRRFANVVLHVAGHQLRQRITPRPDPTRHSQGYWEVTTGSPLDFPMQARLLEIVDNGDGTLSVFSTVYDCAAPLKPGDAQDPSADDGVNEMLLASLARQAAAADPQLDEEAAGLSPSDRNAELLMSAPFDLSGVTAAPPERAGAQAERRGVSRRDLLRVALKLP